LSYIYIYIYIKRVSFFFENGDYKMLEKAEPPKEHGEFLQKGELMKVVKATSPMMNEGTIR
jgi:hypothetical protein